jgi:hypothetical protein
VGDRFLPAPRGYPSGVSSREASSDLDRLLDQAAAMLDRGVREFKSYMASDEGRELRRRLAQVAILSAPLILRMRLFRATWVGRLIAVAGGAALVVKLAEAIRDWEPELGWEPDGSPID